MGSDNTRGRDNPSASANAKAGVKGAQPHSGGRGAGGVPRSSILPGAWAATTLAGETTPSASDKRKAGVKGAQPHSGGAGVSPATLSSRAPARLWRGRAGRDNTRGRDNPSAGRKRQSRGEGGRQPHSGARGCPPFLYPPERLPACGGRRVGREYPSRARRHIGQHMRRSGVCRGAAAPCRGLRGCPPPSKQIGAGGWAAKTFAGETPHQPAAAERGAPSSSASPQAAWSAR